MEKILDSKYIILDPSEISTKNEYFLIGDDGSENHVIVKSITKVPNKDIYPQKDMYYVNVEFLDINNKQTYYLSKDDKIFKVI